MANKIKVFVGFLAFIALFSVLMFFNSFTNSSSISKTAKVTQNSLSFSIDSDIDNDGLSNTEESYWNTDFQNPDTDGDGYIDGEEVASGHHPNKVGPNDALAEAKNLTEKSGSLLVAGLVEGSLKTSSPRFDNSVNSVIDDLFYQSSINHDKTVLANIGDVQIITTDSDKKTVDEYLKKMSPLLRSFWIDDLKGFVYILNMFQELDKTQDYQNPKFTDAIDNEILKFKNQIKQLETIEIPSTWVKTHSQLISEMQSIAKNYLLFRNLGNDPMQGVVSYITLGDEFTDKLPLLLSRYSLNK